MIFSKPIAWQSAVESQQVKSLLPTSLNSSFLADLPADVRERARFSATNVFGDVLQTLDDGIAKLVAGQTDPATVELWIAQSLQKLGYQPAADIRGTIQDLGSDARLRLVTQMNADFSRGFGGWADGQNTGVLDEWPAQELFRLERRREPRNWPQRWTLAGGLIFGGRMIALKNGPIWVAISRFGLPYPPFDYGSGMWTRDVDRDTAMRVGLISRDAQIAPQSRSFNQDLQSSAAVRSQALRDAILLANPDFTFVGDVLALKGAA